MCRIKPTKTLLFLFLSQTVVTLESPHILDIVTSNSCCIASSSSSAVSLVARCELTRRKPSSKLDPDLVLLTDMAKQPAPWGYEGAGGVESLNQAWGTQDSVLVNK